MRNCGLLGMDLRLVVEYINEVFYAGRARVYELDCNQIAAPAWEDFSAVCAPIAVEEGKNRAQ